jgi:Flp pilus assembly protein TadG
VLVALILVPLFLAILQLGLGLYVRNTLAACAQDAARYAADEDIDIRGSDAVQQAAQAGATACIDSSLSDSFAGDITGTATISTPKGDVAGSVAAVDVEVAAPLPMVGFLSVGGLQVRVSGHALQEQP